MTPHGRDWDELRLSEDPAVELLITQGWTYADPHVLEGVRHNLKHPIILPHFMAAIQRLNPDLSPTEAATAAKAITELHAATLAEENELIHRRLVHGWALPRPNGTSKTVRFIDFERPKNNKLTVTRQYRVQGPKREIRPDVVLLINGLPVVIIECKSPTIGDRWRADAIKQLARYQESEDHFAGLGAPQLFRTVQLVVASCGERACFGSLGTPAAYFFEWKDPYPQTPAQLQERLGHPPSAQDILLAGMLRPEALLDIIENFIVFDVQNGRSIKKAPRYKQYIAVNRALERVEAGEDKGGVIWHTQGSGKSLTMLWLALKLRRHQGLDNPGLVIVTDRKELDAQINSTFESCGFDVVRAKSVRQLRQELASMAGKTVTTTVQKFQDATTKAAAKGSRRPQPSVHPVLNRAENIFVMVDEAHRSQYHGLGANLRQALPNARLFGFTGTPIDKTDRSTRQVFGDYIDTYTIEQAVADGATVPIFYESRLAELHVLGNNLDLLFDRYFADKSREERQAIKQRYGTEAAILSAPKRIEAICLDLIEHYQAAIQPNGFKAQLVCNSREVAVRYKEQLDLLNGPESALILSVQHNDAERLTKATPPEDTQRRLIEAFKESGRGPYILIVCDKLLTGFDAPIEQVIYLDKPLREHGLLQAIARTNRRADGKNYGLIVDYWGVATDLKEALSIFAPADVKGALTDKESSLPAVRRRHAAAMATFKAVKDKEDLSACVAVLEPEDVRTRFNEAFLAFSRAMDLLLPDPSALSFQDDLKWLGKIRAAAKARFHDPQLDLSGAGAKVRRLIEEAISASGVQILVKEVSLLSKEFEDKLNSLESDEAKASEMEHAVRREIREHMDENPAFYKSLKKRLEELIKDREEQRKKGAELLLDFQKLCEAVKGERKAADKLGLTETGFAIYGVLQDADAGLSPKAQLDLASVIDEQLISYTRIVDWHAKEHLQKDLRKDIKKTLREEELDLDESTKLAQQLIELAKARFK